MSPRLALESSAPRIHQPAGPAEGLDLKDWGLQPDPVEGKSRSTGRLVHKGPDGRPEVGLWHCSPGAWRLSLPDDEVFYVLGGSAIYLADPDLPGGAGGQEIAAEPGTLIHFKRGWRGQCRVREPLIASYMLSEGADLTGPIQSLARAPQRPAEADWGVIPTMLEGESRVSGILLSRDPDRRAESGLWLCTPGLWECHVTSDEYCHFLDGRSTYTHESGEIIEITPDTLAFFPKDWRGTCRVHETIRKVYMIR